MSVFFEFFSQLSNFNFPWLIDFFMSNLLWLFILSMLVHTLFDGKKFIPGLIFMTFALWLWGDFESLSGVGFMGTQVLVVYYISKISLLAIVENMESLRPHLVMISTISGVVSLTLANIFIN